MRSSLCHVCNVRHPLINDNMSQCDVCGLIYLSPACALNDWFHPLICDENIHNRVQSALRWIIEQYTIAQVLVPNIKLDPQTVGISSYIYKEDPFISTHSLGFNDKRGSGCIICGTAGWAGMTGYITIHPTGLKVGRCKACHEADLKICSWSLLPIWLCDHRKQEIIKKMSIIMYISSEELLPEIGRIISSLMINFRSHDYHQNPCTWYQHNK